MTLFWSALALFQVAFLPGYLATRWLRLDDGFTKTWAFSLGFSLVVNYHLTLLLTAISAYTRTSLCAFIGAELLALVWMSRRPHMRESAEPSVLTRFLCPDGGSVGISLTRTLLLGVEGFFRLTRLLPELGLEVADDAVSHLNAELLDVVGSANDGSQVGSVHL